MGEFDLGKFSNLEHVVPENGRDWGRFLRANRWAILQGRIMVGRELWGALSASSRADIHGRRGITRKGNGKACQSDADRDRAFHVG